MKIELKEISIKDVSEGYKNDDEEDESELDIDEED